MILRPTYVQISIGQDGRKLGFEIKLEAPDENTLDREELGKVFDLCRQLKLVEVEIGHVSGKLKEKP